MAQRLYIKSDLAEMAGVAISNASRDLDFPIPEYVIGTELARFCYTEATTRAWCDKHGYDFKLLPDVTPDWQT